ncbi:MAG: hypothetical protein ACJAUG_002495, partial [Halioglobus sp.]
MKSHHTAEIASMNAARNIEFQITRQLVKRREAHRNSQSVDRVIKVLAAIAGALILAVCVPELLLPIFFASAVVTLG